MINKLRLFVLLAGLVLPHTLSAQTGTNTVIGAVAAEEGLPLLTPDQIPNSGTFWLVMNGVRGTSTAPLPCPPLGFDGYKIYLIADGSFLVDETTNDASTLSADAITAQATPILNLIDSIQTDVFNHEFRMAMGMDESGFGDDEGGGGGFSPNCAGYSWDTNQLWLAITNVANGMAYCNLYNATNQVYAIWSTTNLLSTWQVECEVWPTDTNCQPFTVQTLERQDLFLRAEDWTGVTENGNTTPDWWFWLYFGTTALYDTNLDTQGNTLLYDYQNGLIPPTNSMVEIPLSQEVLTGDIVTFSAKADGSGLSYQWTFNGTNIFNATNSSYTTVNVNPNNAGTYACTIHNGNGAVINWSAILTVDSGSGWPYVTTTIGPRQDYTFRHGVTYEINSPVQLYGETVIEPGAIIKFDPDGIFPSLQILGTLVCKSESYEPAVLTTADDGTFSTWGGDGGPPQAIFTGAPFLDLTEAGNVSLANLRFRYADMAIGAPANSQLDVWNSQFFGCNAGVVNNSIGTNNFHNVLFSGCETAVLADTNTFAIQMEHVTADATNLWIASVSPSSVALTNSIIFGSISGSYSAQNVAFTPDPTNFVVSGAGNYYLAPGSSLRQSGTTNVSPQLLAAFQKKTTSPPMVFPQLMNESNNLTLFPQAARYTNGAPDLGYYYDAMDYTIADMTIYGNVTLEPGTVVGIRNEPIVNGSQYTWWGFDIRENASLISHGFPERPNIIADVQTVQEQDAFADQSLIVPDFEGTPDDNAPVLDFRFTKLYTPPGLFSVWGGNWEFIDYGGSLASENSLVNWSMRDCELHGGRLSLGVPDGSIDFTYYFGTGTIDWENNLFDQVSINLDPATWWYAGTVNVDESFTARNNLFHGGNWFLIEAVPSSAGDWVFTDNLFDGIDFQADSATPFDYDNNGYWPLPITQTITNVLAYTLSLTAGDSTELFSATNNLAGTHEVTLDSAPPYTNSAFGNYYLSQTTPLYQAGSRTASDAGLTQYTTFANQSKDASNQPVNIGLHYVTASTDGTPLDSDGDGIPDYVEAEYGTDPYNAMTDGVTNDIYNAAYFNIDLSGDGLVGRIKAALGINPLDPNNPLTLNQVCWDNQWGIATFEIPVSYNVITNVGNINLFLNGVCVTLQDLSAAPNGNTLVLWNTTFNSSGQHYLQACLNVNVPADDGATLTGVGRFISYNSDNPVRFYENDAIYDDTGAYLDATINSSTNQYYTIQIFDPSTSPPTFLKGITNSTSNGMIQEDWDLTCDDGSSFSGDTFDATFQVSNSDPSIHLTGGVPGQEKKRTKRHAKTSSTEQGNGFDVTYLYTPSTSAMSWDFGSDYGAVWIGMQNVVDTLLMPVTADGGHDNHYDSDFNIYTSQRFPGDIGMPGYITSQSTIDNVLFKSMTNGTTKNFFTYAHGSGETIASYDDSVVLFAPDIARITGNYYSKAKIIKASYPYRFVFLDGCSTASTREWRQAFGIFPYWDTGSPARGKIGNQAFVGFAQSVNGWLNPKEVSTLTENVAFGYTEALSDMYELWMNNRPLAQCIDAVSSPAEDIVPFPVPSLKGRPIHVWGNPGVDGNPYNFYITTSITSPIYIIGHSGLTQSGINGLFDNLPRYNSPVDAP